MKIYHVLNEDEDYENCPYILAHSPEEAYEKAKSLPMEQEYINDEYREAGNIRMVEINPTKKEVRFLYYAYDEIQPTWEVDYANVLEDATEDSLPLQEDRFEH
jgi:hypothetical protein